MIHWKSIQEHGMPTDIGKVYLVTDGREFATTDLGCSAKKGGYYWAGCPCTYEENDCCAGVKVFDLDATHWVECSELNKP